MACKVGICTKDSGGSGIGQYLRGYTLRPFETDDEVGSAHSLVFVEISDADVSDMREFCGYWNVDVDFTVLNHDVPEDKYSVAAYSPTENASHDQAKLLKAMLDEIAAKWNVAYVSKDANGAPAWVKYRYYISNDSYQDECAAYSDGFWEKDVSSVVFEEKSYNSGTGDHTIEADYSALNWKAAAVGRRITDVGGTVNSHTNKVVNFTINRSDVTSGLKTEFRAAVIENNPVSRRRYYASEANVAAIEAAGGSVTRTKAQFEALASDKVAE